ncbi:MAG TPA: carbamoyltransferase C-terminal domain-containing protein [Actinophytocola sp.]|uniref:carbamoyltransferase family protein n=1 Tax=Actinophytocola sp. TaxID=1872138 RepID=UPI002DBDD424|nr:carbamoyltransferase C-terminal domain-containing protein [Actinophytocola sp.]HEU5473549.1 carbamoyltransferase C-terminal domain-containing protein [Actinophytocola sp.]
MTAVLGLGGSGHDWSSCATDGHRLVAVDEERLVRSKYGLGADLLAGVSRRACLGELRLSPAGVDHVVACELVPRPFYHSYRKRVTLINHHLAHAYSAFGASGLDRAAVLVADNSGSLVSGRKAGTGDREVETISGFVADHTGVHLVHRVSGQHILDAGSESAYYQPGETDNSLGQFYRAASLAAGLAYTGPKTRYPVSEDGKTMGLAPYGDDRFVDETAELITLLPDGDVRISASKVAHVFERMTESGTFADRAALAHAAQEILERALVHCATALYEQTGLTDLCIAGGVGLNSVANGRILAETPFQRVFVVPAAGDNGISLGCAYYGLHQLAGTPVTGLPALRDAYLGPAYPPARLDAALAGSGFVTRNPDDLPGTVAELLARGEIVGWFDGRSEFGPRALGHRSIFAAPFPASVREHLNDNVKHREWFRPYAPVIKEERAGELFALGQPSPYMLIVAEVTRPDRIPAATHVDGTARLQTLAREQNPAVYELLTGFEALTGCPVLLNTSFNVAGQPIVETPEDAVAAFGAMHLDHLVLGRLLVSRT